ncbi:MAG: single-stranded-DNA-specific exonuclease RecJ [Oscillospiraceae bacterium]|nr:single-stranded-DNA-specific exonuclease RecJ [Oscillospiraceae bacterium]
MRGKPPAEWVIPKPQTVKAAALAAECGFSPLMARLLVARGADTPEKAKKLLDKSSALLHDPFLLDDMDKACKCIISAVRAKMKIIIFGDYDVDGVTSSVIVCQYLRSLGAKVNVYIPERITEGYGLNPDAVRSFAVDDVGLIITVDSGITANEEIALAKSLGINVVITDHHTCRLPLPDADAVVNPKRPDSKYPFPELAGVGVAFKLLCALDSSFFSMDIGISTDKICNLFCDLIAIGTIADVMPIADENRLLVTAGLEQAENTKNIGLEALIAEVGFESSANGRMRRKKLSSTHIGFVIAPRINACGRIGSAMRAVELFLTDSRGAARVIAAELCATNRQRQLYENEILNEVEAIIEKDHDFEHDLFIIVQSNKWHHGVIGIVASRICEKYHLPCILVSFAGEDADTPEEYDMGKGSGRSIKGLNLVEALASASDCLIKFGGHEMAAGLSVQREKLPELKRRLNEYAHTHLTKEDLAEHIYADCELYKSDINLKAASEILQLEPFGLNNPVPLFLISEFLITEVISIGDNRHTKLTLVKDELSVPALYFGVPACSFAYFPGDRVDIICNMDINVFRTNKNVQLTVRDIRPSRQAVELVQKRLLQYQCICSGNSVRIAGDMIPVREDFKRAFLYIRRKLCDMCLLSTEAFYYDKESSFVPVDINAMMKIISADSTERTDILKMLLIIDIFEEMELILRRKDPSKGFPMIQEIMLLPPSPSASRQKINLEKSELMRRLQFETEINETNDI